MWGEVLGMALLAGLLIWLLRGRNAAVVSRETRTDLTYEEREAAEELQQAEEEVKKRDTSSQPDDEEPGDDWGPGTPRSY
jgi:hypothetical protein